jgi:hypothetical protein
MPTCEQTSTQFIAALTAARATTIDFEHTNLPKIQASTIRLTRESPKSCHNLPPKFFAVNRQYDWMRLFAHHQRNTRAFLREATFRRSVHVYARCRLPLRTWVRTCAQFWICPLFVAACGVLLHAVLSPKCPFSFTICKCPFAFARRWTILWSRYRSPPGL